MSQSGLAIISEHNTAGALPPKNSSNPNEQNPAASGSGNITDPAQDAYDQYKEDLAKWQRDNALLAEAGQEWSDLIDKIKQLLSNKTSGSTQAAFNIVLYQLLGPTLVDKYYGGQQNVQGDVMNMVSDIRTITNNVQSIFNDSNNKPITPTQAAQFNESLKDLYAIFQQQKNATDGSQWLDADSSQNLMANLDSLYGAFSDPSKNPIQPGQDIPIDDLQEMSTWWTPQADNSANPQLSLFQNSLGSLISTISSPSQVAQAKASYMISSQSTIEGAIKAIESSMIALEGAANQKMASGA